MKCALRLHTAVTVMNRGCGLVRATRTGLVGIKTRAVVRQEHAGNAARMGENVLESGASVSTGAWPNHMCSGPTMCRSQLRGLRVLARRR